jgi:hypothetical protein
MRLSGADFSKLQFSLLAAILMTSIGAISVYVALNATKTAKLGQAAAQTQRNDFDGKLKRASNEENEIRQKSALFNELQNRGVIGEEQRLEWVELLKEIRDRRRLIDLQYEIAPQRPLDANPGSDFAFYSSTMKVQLKLLHEEDLARLLNDLRQQARALIQVKSCNVSRLPRGNSERGATAQLQADCEIDWVTLREVANK